MPAKRILCVEDNEDTCFILETLLSRQDFEVVSAPDAEEALRLIEKEKFNLYIVDTALPAMSGLDFCKEVRKVDPETPILFASASISNGGPTSLLLHIDERINVSSWWAARDLRR